MTTPLALLSAALLLAPTLPAQTAPAPVVAMQNAGKTGGSPAPLSRQQNEVEKVVLAQEKAWNAGDLTGYLALFKDAPDTEAVLSGPVRGMANIRAAYQANYPGRDKMGLLEQSEVEVRALGEDHALASGKYHLSRSRKNGGDADGVFWEIFEKADGRWQIVFSATV